MAENYKSRPIQLIGVLLGAALRDNVHSPDEKGHKKGIESHVSHVPILNEVNYKMIKIIDKEYRSLHIS